MILILEVLDYFDWNIVRVLEWCIYGDCNVVFFVIMI